MNIETRLSHAQQLAFLRAYRPKNRKAKRSLRAKRKRITRAIMRRVN